MSFGPPTNRPAPPPKGEAARDTWVPCPWNPKLEQNLETPPKLRTKGHQPPMEPPLVHPTIVMDEGEEDPTWGLYP
jgi:hypothetical protein